MDTTSTPVSTASTEAALNDLTKDVAFIRQVVAAIKSGGVQSAAPLLPDAITSIERTVKDVETAIPEIKAGYKTTEFWLTVGAVAVTLGYETFAGKDLPINATVLIGAVVTIYTTARTLFKSNTATPAPAPVPAPAPTPVPPAVTPAK